jgi:hypothetical protein
MEMNVGNFHHRVSVVLAGQASEASNATARDCAEHHHPAGNAAKAQAGENEGD